MGKVDEYLLINVRILNMLHSYSTVTNMLHRLYTTVPMTDFVINISIIPLLQYYEYLKV
jgi:hypothetical protein